MKNKNHNFCAFTYFKFRPINIHMKKSIVIFLLFFSFLTSMLYGQLPGRQQISLDENWNFHLGNSADPLKDFNYGIANSFAKSAAKTGTAIDAGFKDSDWQKVTIPHDWAVELPFVKVNNFDVMAHGYKPLGGLFSETNIGWYRKHFSIAKTDSGQRFQLQFDGIARDANIWINGFYLGNNKSGYVGVNFDVTDFINFDKDNVIVVRADAAQFEGWFYEGAGIYRLVWLNTYNNLHIAKDGVFAYSKVINKTAVISVETTVENDNFSSGSTSVKAFLKDRNGVIVGSSKAQVLSLTAGGSGTLKHTITITDPMLWSLENPYLYRVVVQLSKGTAVQDVSTFRFGIRTVDIKVNGIFLNGKYVKIKGVNNHQDHAGVGSALPDYLQYYRIGLLKNLGANAYRTSHGAPTSELLDACDSLGMLVLDEQRLLTSSAEYLNQFDRLVKRDRNHAAIFLWSIGNEEGYIQTTDYGKRIAQTFIARQKQLDPSRTCTYAADLANVFSGVNEVIPVRGFNYRQFGVEAYHKDHPLQPIIGTEMGSTLTTRGIYQKDSIRGYLPDQDITAPWWASRAEEWWKLAAENSYWLGGFVWTGFDYRGEPTPYEWPNINSHFGIMDVCGFPKNIYYYYQSWWTDKDVLHISPHWNWRGKEGTPIDVWVNTNADNVELFLNGKSLGKKNMPRNSHLQWSVNYEQGILKAIAYKKGKLLTAQVQTTGQPVEVVVTPYKTTILADGRDAVVVNISVIDKQGLEVPDADNLIKFSIEGAGKIIGVGNGDPSSHEPDKCIEGAWQRNLFNGKCQVIIQSDNHAGAIKFKATATGLYDGATDILTVSPLNDNRITIDKNYLLTGASAKARFTDKILGADISFLPELEHKGIKFSDKGVSKDAIEILKDHGFNYIRLRIFNNPSSDSGYSPKLGFCDLLHTLAMAKRVKKLGLKLLLDFHYSDTWADPGKQFLPAAWKSLSFSELKKALNIYTKDVLQQMKDQGTLPDMVQIGNEINHGIDWPVGSIAEPDNLAQLLSAGIAAVKAVDPSTIIMLHVALGGQNDESVSFINSMLKRGVHFDVIGESYYPKWHGTTDDLRDNLNDLIKRFNKEIVVVEYSQLKDEVNKITFNLSSGKGKGTFIWEPLSTWEHIFDADGKSNSLLMKYDELSSQFLHNK